MPTYQTTGHRLRRNHCNALPRYIVAFDTETVPTVADTNGRKFTHQYRLSSAISCRLQGTNPVAVKSYGFKDTAAFWRMVYGFTGPRHTTWLVAHNVLFDLVVSGFAERFANGELAIDWPRSKRTREDNDTDNVHCHGLAIIETPPTIIACRVAETQGRLVCVDTLNWFPTSLKTLGDAAGLPKLDMPDFSAGDETWLQYCHRDTEIVFHTFIELIRWVRSSDFGMFRYTAPSQAMSAYRHRFMSQPILIHDNADVKYLERTGYFGGRTECFRLGKIAETVHQLDCNALFPSVMASGEYPVKLNRFDLIDDWMDLLPDIDWSASVAEVELITTLPNFPKRIEHGVYYPIGRFSTVLCGRELFYAYRHKCIRRIKSWAEYTLAPLFASWVSELWQRRQEYKASGNTLYEQFTKRLMNSLYGKFGQRNPKWVNVPDAISPGPWCSWSSINTITNERVDYRSFGYTVQQQADKGEVDGTFVAVSAFVTSAARMRMNELRMRAGRRNVYYQGVDGLIVNGEGRYRLEQSGEVSDIDLGRLRVQLTCDGGDIIAASDYRLADKVVIAGRSARCETGPNGEVLQRKMSAVSHLFSGKVTNHVTEELQPWQRVAVFHKGTIGSDGWVEPVVLGVDN